MRRRERNVDLFSLAFLDVIACGFGAIVLLLLISGSGVTEAPGAAETDTLLRQTFRAEEAVERLSAELRRLRAQLERQRAQSRNGLAESEARERELRAARARVERLERENHGLERVRRSLERAAISADTARERDREVGGIPVDSDYVVFIIDTSGSMKGIRERVMREIGNVLDIHPRVRGFQILNDNGAHLVRAYRGRWIPDTPQRRRSVLGVLRGWNAVSNSSPVEGLEVALRTYGRKNEKVSVYIFGDDYSGSSYDTVIETLDRLNTDGATGRPRVRVHAVGFLSGHGNGRFPTLMREVTKRGRGTFLALPP